MEKYKFDGKPEEILKAAKELVEHIRDGSDESNVMFDILLMDLKQTIHEYDQLP